MAKIADKHEFLNQEGRVCVTIDGAVPGIAVDASGGSLARMTATRFTLGSLSLPQAGPLPGQVIDELVDEIGHLEALIPGQPTADPILFWRLGGRSHRTLVRILDRGLRRVLVFRSEKAELTLGAKGNAGDLVIADHDGSSVLAFRSQKAELTLGAKGNAGDVLVVDQDGNPGVRISGEKGDIELHGADCAEDFLVNGQSAVAPGSVVVIDQGRSVSPCIAAYDRRVAGVISGAGGLRPALILGKRQSPERCVPVALSGTVECMVDASYGPIGIGDLLTTSATPGHAMRAMDPQRSFGAVLGKALDSLLQGRGMIPILVALQ